MEEFTNNENPVIGETNFLMKQIEKTLQVKFNLYVPAIVFKLSADGIDWDYDDLYDTLQSFGEVDMLETNTDIAVVLYKKFLDAFASLEFLKDKKFYNQNNDSFCLRWYTKEDEANISKCFKRKIQSFIEKNSQLNKENDSNLNSTQQYMRNTSNVFFQDSIPQNSFVKSPILSNLSYMNNYEMTNINPNFNKGFNTNNFTNTNNHQILKNSYNNNTFNNQNTYKSPQTPTLLHQSPTYVHLMPDFNITNPELGNNNFMNKNLNNNSQNEYKFYQQNNGENNQKYMYNTMSSLNQEHSQSGIRKNSINANEVKEKEKNSNEKFTCKFEIQIENDNEFQVCRKLIGSKGCNMKNIVDICKNNSMVITNEPVKLRLRGRGSGYKEGPEQKESEESLHLCISSKYQDTYYLACKLVEELIMQMYNEYKIFNDKKGLNIPRLNIRKIEGDNINVNYNMNKNLSKKNTK